MTTRWTPRLVWSAVAAAVVAAAGCGGGTGTVTGEVTYEGTRVKSGHITFAPADGKGPTAGGPITDGRYSVENVTPGPKVVTVVASSEETPSVRSSEDGARMTPEQKARYDPKTGIISADTVPPDAEGNGKQVEVKAGSQEMNFALKKPPGKK